MHILLCVLHNYTAITKYHQAIDRSLNWNCNCVTLWILTLCIINQQQSSMTKVNNILMLKKHTSCKISSNTEKGQSHLLILGLVNQFCLALSIISLIREVYWLNALHLKNVKLQLLSRSFQGKDLIDCIGFHCAWGNSHKCEMPKIHSFSVTRSYGIVPGHNHTVYILPFIVSKGVESGTFSLSNIWRAIPHGTPAGKTFYENAETFLCAIVQLVCMNTINNAHQSLKFLAIHFSKELRIEYTQCVTPTHPCKVLNFTF